MSEPRVIRLRLVSDGNPNNTYVTDAETGDRIDVCDIRWTMRGPDELGELTVTVDQFDVELVDRLRTANVLEAADDRVATIRDIVGSLSMAPPEMLDFWVRELQRAVEE